MCSKKVSETFLFRSVIDRAKDGAKRKMKKEKEGKENKNKKKRYKEKKIYLDENASGRG